MQQYFVSEKLDINKTISLNEDIVFHLSKVLRNSEKEFRLVDINGDVYLANLNGNIATIFDKINENNELVCNTTALICLIKQDKFEMILQKLCELGINKIIPVNSAYSQDLIFTENRVTRFNKIIKEACEQSHRNFLPILENPVNFEDVIKYKSDLNIVPYEKSSSKCLDSLKSNSISFIIGPEGGFKKEEVEYLIKNNFKEISLGKRILRAETAAISMMSYILKDNQ